MRNKITAPFWNGELERMRRIARARRKSYQQARDPELRTRKLEEYRIVKKEYKERLMQRKKELWETFTENNLAIDAWGAPYKLCMKKLSSTTLPTLKKEDGTYTKTWEESARLILEELVPKDSDVNETEENKKNKRGYANNFERSIREQRLQCGRIRHSK